MSTTINKGLHPIKMWADPAEVEASAFNQLINIANLPWIHKHVAVMPDVHYGKGATVGSVIAMKDAVAPSAVGVDIGCLDKDTEVLTPSGWVAISLWDQQEILQYNLETDTASFVVPTGYIKRQNTSGFYKLKSNKGLDQMISDDHRVLYFYGTSKRGFTPKTEVASDFISHQNSLTKGKSGGFKTTFGVQTEGVSLTNDEIRILIMVQADGTIRSNGTIEVHVKKDRKIARAKDLLEAAGIEYRTHNYKDGSKGYAFQFAAATKDLSLLWGASQDQLKVVTDEVLHWDGHSGYRSYYSSTDKRSADLIQYAFAVSGVRCSIYASHSTKLGHSICYQVILTRNEFVNLPSSQKIEKVPSEDGYEYCFQVPSTYFVARRGDNIFITGNCGMAAVKTSLELADLPDSLNQIRKDIEKAIPVGRGMHSSALKSPAMSGFNDLTVDVGRAASRAACQVGTLGGGNHFIELCVDDNGSVWMMLHSGSRGVGKEIADRHINIAKTLEHNAALPDPDLAVFLAKTQEMQNYRHDLMWAQNYAKENRAAMLMLYKRVLAEHFPMMSFTAEINCHHNYVAEEFHFGSDVLVTRKGAISADVGEWGIIPGSMGTGSYIVRGRGNPESFHSASHGAGRRMSRGEAKRRYTTEDVEEQTAGVECRKDSGIIDEIPAAYKDIDTVIAQQADLVDVHAHLTALLCVKG